MGKTRVKLPAVYIISAPVPRSHTRGISDFSASSCSRPLTLARACVRACVRVIASPARQPGRTTRADGESSERKQDRKCGHSFAFQNEGAMET